MFGTYVSMTSFHMDLEAILMDPTYRHEQSDPSKHPGFVDPAWRSHPGAFKAALAQGKVAMDYDLCLVWNSAFDAKAVVYIDHPRDPDKRNGTLNNHTSARRLCPALGKYL